MLDEKMMINDEELDEVSGGNNNVEGMTPIGSLTILAEKIGTVSDPHTGGYAAGDVYAGETYPIYCVQQGYGFKWLMIDTEKWVRFDSRNVSVTLGV